MSWGLKDKTEALLAAERGTVFKARGAAVEVALAYPNTYLVGISNLGVHQMYSVLNRRSDTSCERVFLPDAEDLPEYARSGAELVSLESQRPVKQFDILAFSVSFEQDYLNVLEMLRLAGIAINKADRTEDDPLLVLGGICSFFNPEPLADFFDVVIIGEGEEAAGEFIEAYLANRDRGRRGLLRALCAVSGVYVPELYEITYHADGTIRSRHPNKLLLRPSFFRAIRSLSDPHILYIPEACATVASFIRTRILHIFTGKRVTMLSLQSQQYFSLKRYAEKFPSVIRDKTGRPHPGSWVRNRGSRSLSRIPL